MTRRLFSKRVQVDNGQEMAQSDIYPFKFISVSACTQRHILVLYHRVRVLLELGIYSVLGPSEKGTLYFYKYLST